MQALEVHRSIDLILGNISLLSTSIGTKRIEDIAGNSQMKDAAYEYLLEIGQVANRMLANLELESGRRKVIQHLSQFRWVSDPNEVEDGFLELFEIVKKKLPDLEGELKQMVRYQIAL